MEIFNRVLQWPAFIVLVNYPHYNYFYLFFCLDQSGEIPRNCNKERCKIIEDTDDDVDDNQEDLYALLIVPILGVIGGFSAYIYRRFRDRLVFRILATVLDCFAGGEEEGESTMADTETTSADTNFVKQRFTDPGSLDISSIYPANSSSISANTWENRMRTDAKIIFDRLKDDRSTNTSIEMRDIATQDLI